MLESALKHLYINPLERCNLHCAICYTKKTSPVLSDNQILNFVKKYQKVQKLETITFCGGEVFLLPYFTNLVNALTKQRLFIQIITNATIDRLKELNEPNAINLIGSIDGQEQYHDQNRGKGNFQKSMAFMKKAQNLGFHTEIFTIVTKQNYPLLNEFEKYIHDHLGKKISVTYHPRKPLTYLANHPSSNVVGKTRGFNFLNKHELTTLINTKKTFPPRVLGCYQISLMSDGFIYGCCEGVQPIGSIHDKIETLITRLTNEVRSGCSYPDFICGFKNIYE